MSTISPDDHNHGLYANSPVVLFVLFLLTGGVYALFSILQVTGTQQTVFDILQIGLQIKPGMTGSEVQQYLDGSLSHNQTIAAAIGWGVQVALVLFSFSPDHALANMHRKYNSTLSASLSNHAASLAKARSFLARCLIGGDIITDFYYVAQGHIVMDGWHPSVVGNVGVLIVGVVYAVAVIYITVFVGKYAFAYLDAFMDVLYRFFKVDAGLKKPLPPSAASGTR